MRQRRLEAARMFACGVTQAEVARAFGVRDDVDLEQVIVVLVGACLAAEHANLDGCGSIAGTG